MNWRWCAAALLALAAAGCKDTRLNTSGCRQDSDCGDPAAAWRCDSKAGLCYCRTDAACPVREFCNAAGFCQDRAGCEKNADCQDPSLFCDTSSGTCLVRGRCGSDLHCPLGQVCDTASSTCKDGCRGNGDCPGSACRCGDVACGCAATTEAGRSACAIGECDPYFCASPADCKFGETCGVAADAGSPRASCYSDFDVNERPYCANCTSGGGVDTCGYGPNFCIIDTRTRATYCGADCSDGQSCPHGYGCRDIIVVFSRWACSETVPCPANPSLPCAADSDCQRGATCLKPLGATTGSCSGQCRVREGASVGFCSCQIDDDCAQETCTKGECSITKKKCITENDCRRIHCVDFNGAGGCLIGQNCTPANGLTCLEVQ